MLYVGDGENLRLPDASVDTVLSECTFCMFPSKEKEVSEFARVLRPGGAVGISDLTRSGQLPIELDGLLAWIACIADLSNPLIEAHDESLSEMVAGIRGKLLGVDLLVQLGKLPLPAMDINAAKAMARHSEKAVREGLLGYALIIARTEEILGRAQ